MLSGGEQTRLRLARLLLERPDVLILDEPTNHLDLTTMDWLETYLKAYRGAVLVVSHDPLFSRRRLHPHLGAGGQDHRDLQG